MNLAFRGFCIALFAVLAFLGNPQSAAAQGDGWGLTVGAASSELDGDYVARRGDAEWGFTGGVYGERRLAGNLAVYLGVEYAKRGGKAVTGSLSQLSPLDIDTDYVGIPFLLEVLLPLGSTWDLVAYGGIAANINVKCRAAFAGGDKQSCKDTELGGPKTAWSLPAGGGLSYRVGESDAVVFEARYSWGLSDIVADQQLRQRGWNLQVRLARTM